MGYLEVILFGYMINVIIFVGILVLTLILSLGGVFIWGDKAQFLSEGMFMTKLNNTFNDVKSGVPSKVYMTVSDYSILFPFMMVFNGVKYLWFCGKYGINGYLILTLQDKLQKVENYLKWKNEQEK